MEAPIIASDKSTINQELLLLVFTRRLFRERIRVGLSDMVGDADIGEGLF